MVPHNGALHQAYQILWQQVPCTSTMKKNEFNASEFKTTYVAPLVHNHISILLLLNFQHAPSSFVLKQEGYPTIFSTSSSTPFQGYQGCCMRPCSQAKTTSKRTQGAPVRPHSLSLSKQPTPSHAFSNSLCYPSFHHAHQSHSCTPMEIMKRYSFFKRWGPWVGLGFRANGRGK